MTFEEWLKKSGFDAETLSDVQRTALLAAWKAEQAPPPPARPPREPERTERESGGPDGTFEQKMQAIEAEAERVRCIEERTAETAARHTGSPEKIKQLRELCAAAVLDPKMDARAYELALVRADRAAGPWLHVPSQPQITPEVLEAAVCRAGGLETLERDYDARTLETAHRQFKGGLGLAAVITYCARRNGYNGHDFKTDWFRAVKAAFRGSEVGEFYAATTAPSTYSLPNIFSNVANKFLRVGFDAVDNTWSRVSARRSLNDFKTATTIALTGGLLYNKVAPSGELRHGTLGETTYTQTRPTPTA
jgi:hypothetical protein